MNCMALVTSCGTCGSHTSKDILLWCSGVGGELGKLRASINKEFFRAIGRVDMCAKKCCSIFNGSADVDELIRRLGVGDDDVKRLLLLLLIGGVS